MEAFIIAFYLGALLFFIGRCIFLDIRVSKYRALVMMKKIEEDVKDIIGDCVEVRLDIKRAQAAKLFQGINRSTDKNGLVKISLFKKEVDELLE